MTTMLEHGGPSPQDTSELPDTGRHHSGETADDASDNGRHRAAETNMSAFEDMLDTPEAEKPVVLSFAEKLHNAADRVESWHKGRVAKAEQNEAYATYQPNIEATWGRERAETIAETKAKLRKIGLAAISPFTKIAGGIRESVTTVKGEVQETAANIKSSYEGVKNQTHEVGSNIKESIKGSGESVKNHFREKAQAASDRKVERTQSRLDKRTERAAEHERKQAERLEAAAQAAEKAKQRKDARKARRAELVQSAKAKRDSILDSVTEKGTDATEAVREKAKAGAKKIGEGALLALGTGLVVGESLAKAGKNAAETGYLKGAEAIDKAAQTARRARALGSAARSAVSTGVAAGRDNFNTHLEQNSL